ncbi:DNA polymerase III subunit gamma/tau [Allosphingosinicella flava]|uniref:DNA polymerase III subunit gamma/tau n=1 Tax=Allosphingosinicella flava TaxID=2771430 RepID=A0A7T2GL29_9SPHN|nr:DNA polymerase III subunit gamma/tau [Sphingosinicella flava]QPQ55834.1 DNA polymerase III subunit gamma/tau [Sphingosinicella flava]
MSESPQPYRVLARKYRPQSFGELIGQDAMVRTLGNAIRRGRLAHAFLLTGVRGVGKTSTARIMAKALNCVGPDGQGGPTIDPCGVCEYCTSIMEGRNVDVIEMDAASHTGVDDMRSIIDISRNTGFGARFQVFIIDEVHMLSKNAFNALLKTLEEPPENTKFLLATTEVNKVPVTVLSRCQRFDLRRISAEQLAAHFAEVVQKEGVTVEPEALALIARAAEGSARDGLSILDQAIAHGAEGVTAEQVRGMLGLSDRGAVRRLLALLLAGDAQGALAAVKEQHNLGVEPSAIVRGLLESVHGITRAKVGGGDDPAQSAEEREAYAEWASRLGHAALHRLWQLLLKGLNEVNSAAMPMEAAEMALLRIVHASDMPDPGTLMEKLMSGEAVPARASASAAAPPPEPQTAMLALPATFEALVRALQGNGKALLAQQLHDYAGVVRYAPPALEIRPAKPLPGDFQRDLTAALKSVTGAQWTVAISDAPSEPTLLEQEKMAAEANRQKILDHPIVSAAREVFPGAELIDYPGKERRSA